MPVSLARADGSTLMVRATGHVTYDESQHLIDEVARFADLSQLLRVLVDSRGVSGAPTTDELRAIARDLKPLIATGGMAVAIVTDNLFAYGVARTFAAVAPSNAKVEVFRDMEAAAKWLEAV